MPKVSKVPKVPKMPKIMAFYLISKWKVQCTLGSLVVRINL